MEVPGDEQMAYSKTMMSGTALVELGEYFRDPFSRY
jgi:hypothetical protein